MTLKLVFFINAGVLPLVVGFHATSLVMVNEPGSSPGIYAFSAFSVLLSLYLMAGFVFCDKGVVTALQACTGSAKKGGSTAQRGGGGVGQPTAPQQAAQRSALSYR